MLQVASDRRNTFSELDGSTKLALAFLLLLIVLALFSQYFTFYPPAQQGDLLHDRFLPPSAEHPFGTDKFGRDVYSRVIYGAKVSLGIAFTTLILALSIGILYGSISGYFGGLVDVVMMRVLDFYLAFPSIYLFIAVAAIFTPSLMMLIALLSFNIWMEIARIVRAEVLSIKERPFVLMAKNMGFSHTRILFRHILPNSLTPVIAIIPLKIAEIILMESALSFLGIGVQPPMPSWGSIINDGREALHYAWWVSTIPGLFIAITVLCFNKIGALFNNASS
jgi:peptide/nickel transport system permease protein